MKLELGLNDNVEVRVYEERADMPQPLTILFLSDFHLRKKSKSLTFKLDEIIQVEKPDLILLGGDYSESEYGLKLFVNWVNSLAKGILIYGVFGNHDRRAKNRMDQNYLNFQLNG